MSFAVFLVAGVTVLWTYRLDLSQLAATRLLDRAGLGPVKLTISRLDLSGLRVHDISLYGGAIRTADLTLAYDPLRLAAGVVDQAEIIGLHVTMAAAGDEITVGGAPLPFATSPGGGAPTGGFRINAIKIVKAHVAFDSPTGPLEATFSTDLAFSGADIRNATITADLTMPVAGAAQTIHIFAPHLALASQDGGGQDGGGQDGGGLRLFFDKVTIQPKGLPWDVGDLGGEIVWRGDQLLAKIGSSLVRSTRSPPALVPLRVSGDATMRGSQIDFAVHVVGEAIGAKGKIKLDAVGQHDRTSGIGRSNITVAPVVFQVGGLQPQDFFPAIGAALPHLTGSAAISGSMTWLGTTVSPALVLRLADVGYEPEGARLSNIHGDIKFTGLWPVATAPGQVLNGIVEAGGMAPSNATLIFHLLPKPALSVESMRMNFVGGQITASPFIIDPTRPNFETVVGLRQIDLAAVLKLINIDGLRGSGRVDGAIPLAVSGGKVVVREGEIAATGPGVIQIQKDALPKQITDAGESMALALQALADFHYDSLVMNLAEKPTGDGTITLRLHGRNPAVLEGRAFNLNITLESKFDRLIDLVMRSMAVTQELLRRTTGSTQR